MKILITKGEKMTNKYHNNKEENLDKISKRILEMWMAIPRSFRILALWVIIFTIAIMGWIRLL